MTSARVERRQHLKWDDGVFYYMLSMSIINRSGGALTPDEPRFQRGHGYRITRVRSPYTGELRNLTAQPSPPVSLFI